MTDHLNTPETELPTEIQAETQEAPEAQTENWEAKIEALCVEVQSWKDKALRAAAEAENTRRRAEQDVDAARKFALERFARDLLGVRDALETGLNLANGENSNVNQIKEGLELTGKQLLQVFERNKIQEISPKDEAFNPDLHEAVSAIPSPDHAPNTVIQVLQKGYSLNGRLLRPAMVIVSAA